MDNLAHAGFVWIALGCLALTIVSAIVPWVNAEIIVLALPALAHSPLELAALIVIATAGQMSGKCAVYWTGRRGGQLKSARAARAMERWRSRFAHRPWTPLALVLISSTVGFPPFYAITLLAGALRVNFRHYLAAGTVGRLVRFSALALLTAGHLSP